MARQGSQLAALRTRINLRRDDHGSHGLSSWSRQTSYVAVGPDGETRRFSVTRTTKSNAIQLFKTLNYWSSFHSFSARFLHTPDPSHSKISQVGEDRLEALRDNGLHGQISVQEVYTVRGKIIDLETESRELSC